MSLNNLKLDKWTEILPLIEKNNTTSKIVKAYGMTSSHTIGIIQYFIQYKLISVKQDGREKILTLTDKGIKTNKILRELREQLK